MYFTGCFRETAKFGDITLTSYGSYDIFTVKYNAQGELVWVRQAGSSDYESGRSIKVDKEGNVYTIGVNSPSTVFGDQTLDNGGAFIVKYDKDGNLIYLKNIFTVDKSIPVPGNVTVNDFVLVGNENIIVTGFINVTVKFSSMQITGLGSNKIFIAKIKDDPSEVEYSHQVPSVFVLHQNYPNPFNPSTTIVFSLPLRTFVSLKVFDALGREVSNLVSEELSAGTYSRQWNAGGFASGIYFYRLQAGHFLETKKLLLLR